MVPSVCNSQPSGLPGARGKSSAAQKERAASAAPIRLFRRFGVTVHQPFFGCKIFIREAVDHFGGWYDLFHRANTLAAAPDVFPGLFVLVAARAEVHLGRVAHGQVLGIKARSLNGRREIVTVHARKQVGVDDIIGTIVDNRLLVTLVRVGFFSCDEAEPI